jgi:hypothetical protein
MALFPLPHELAAVHNEAIEYAAATQNLIADRGGCRSGSSEALNILVFNAVLTHRGVRSICEEGWAPVASLLNRTLLDIFGNCVAVCNVPANADYMGFKYISHFYRKWLLQPGVTDPERDEANSAISILVGGLNHTDQHKARALCAEPTPSTYWFQPEYRSMKAILEFAEHPLYGLFRFYSGPTHGGFDMKLVLNDDPKSEDIGPREHPKSVPKAIVACSRLLAETCYVRDNWDNESANEPKYKRLVANIIALRN